jgi:nucleoside-diphosphate-sugar epimerase/predicted dehydrogenase
VVGDQSIKVGILGAGYIADWHMKALKQVKQARVIAVADANVGRARNFAARYGIADAVANIAELIGRGCQAVHVLLPPDAHFTAAAQLLDAGVHVFLEKPACTRLEDCESLAELAQRVSRRVGVGHNFLFAPVYERLKADVAAGLLGPISEVSIVWCKELGQLRAGPFGGWMFREPGNILLEIGPHSMAHLQDLVGAPERLRVEVDREMTLPSGKPFFRRWNIRADVGQTAVDLQFSLGAGFTEHRIHARGLIGSATADFEAGTYVHRRHAPLPDDFDRWQMTRNEGKALIRQSRAKLLRYGLSKLKLVKQGNDFGASLARSVAAFYTDMTAPIDSRLSLPFAGRVVGACLQAAARLPAPQRGAVIAVCQAPAPPTNPDVLVLGGTGFIGQALVRQLVQAGKSVRVLVRDPRNLPLTWRGLSLEVVNGDLANRAGLERALANVATVYHLARAHVKTWSEYVQQEIGGTRNLAEACLKAGTKRLMYTGTIDSYFAGKAVVLDDDAPLDPKVHRRNLYARAKAESEQQLRQMHRGQGLPVAIFRPGIVIGRGGNPFHWGVGMWTASAVCRLWGRGENPLPLVLVEDVARALVAAAGADGVVGENFNLVGEPLLNAREYNAELEKAGGLKLDVRPTPILSFYCNDMVKWCAKVMVRHPERRLPSFRDWQSRAQRAAFDCGKAKRLLGWLPCADRGRMIEEGIAQPVREWFE